MKKRIRKKLHRKEFQEVGCALRVATTEADIQTTLDDITNLAAENGMHFYGGGMGYIILPEVENKNCEVPDKAAYLVESIAMMPDLFSDFVMGYFMNAKGEKLTEEQKSAISKYVSTLTVEHDVNLICDLWN